MTSQNSSYSTHPSPSASACFVTISNTRLHRIVDNNEIKDFTDQRTSPLISRFEDASKKARIENPPRHRNPPVLDLRGSDSVPPRELGEASFRIRLVRRNSRQQLLQRFKGNSRLADGAALAAPVAAVVLLEDGLPDAIEIVLSQRWRRFPAGRPEGHLGVPAQAGVQLLRLEGVVKEGGIVEGEVEVGGREREVEVGGIEIV